MPDTLSRCTELNSLQSRMGKGVAQPYRGPHQEAGARAWCIHTLARWLVPILVESWNTSRLSFEIIDESTLNSNNYSVT